MERKYKCKQVESMERIDKVPIVQEEMRRMRIILEQLTNHDTKYVLLEQFDPSASNNTTPTTNITI